MSQPTKRLEIVISIRSRIEAKKIDDSTVMIHLSRGRRILFLAVAALLVVAFMVGVDFSTSFSGPELGGTIFYILLTLTTILAAGWDSRTVFAKAEEAVFRQKAFFGVAIASKSLPIGSVRALVCHGVKLLEGYGRRPRFVERRAQLYKLLLETDEALIPIEDSTTRDDLDRVAGAVGEFLNLPYRYEEL